MFDPYRKWLGIQPKEQPPNYYRLLSVDVFENDLDVIEGAADRAMGFIRQYQSGEHAVEAARILNEVATARICLLKPDKKAAYDAKLRNEMAMAAPHALMEQNLADLPLSDADLKPLARPLNRKKKSGKSQSAQSRQLMIGIGAAVVLVAIVFLINGRKGRLAENQPAPGLETHSAVSKMAVSVNAPPLASEKPPLASLKPELASQNTAQVTLPTPIEIAKSKTAETEPVTTIEPKVPMQAEASPTPAKSSIVEQPVLIRTWQGTLGRNQFGVFSADGQRLVYAIGNDILIVDTETGANVVKLSGHKKAVGVARFSSDDSRVVSVGQDETIRIWDTKDQKQVSLIRGKNAETSSVLMASKNAGLIAFSSANNRRFTVLDALTKAQVRRIDLTEHEVEWRAITLDYKWGMSNGIRNQTTIWDLNTGVSFQIDNGHHNYCGYFTEDGTQAMLGGGYNWDLWDFQEKKILKQGTVTGGHIYAIGISPDTSRFMTGLADGTIWLWDLATAQKLMSFKGHDKPLAALMMSPDMKTAISQDNSGVIRLWRLPD